MPGVQLCPRKHSTSGESGAALPAKISLALHSASNVALTYASLLATETIGTIDILDD